MDRYLVADDHDTSMMADDVVFRTWRPASSTEQVRIPLCVCCDFRRGKLAEARVYLEIPALLEQIGASANPEPR